MEDPHLCARSLEHQVVSTKLESLLGELDAVKMELQEFTLMLDYSEVGSMHK